ERRPSSAVAHPRHKEHPAPFGYLLCTAIRSGKGLIVLERIERREPGIAVSMEEDELAAACGKSGQIRRCWLYQRIGGMQSFFVYIDLRCVRISAKDAAGAEGKQPRNPTGVRNTSV